jgi:hypothetical protein
MRPFQKSGFGARISSRITTVIRVANTIKQTITDLMSHSQFHSQHDPPIPVAENSSSGAETGEEVNLTEHKQLEKAVERAEAPTPASRSASESTSDRTWSSSARVCSTGTRARCQVRPAPPGRHEAKRDTFTFEFHQGGYATQEPRLAASLVGPWAESDGAAGRQFGAQARSLPTRTTR